MFCVGRLAKFLDLYNRLFCAKLGHCFLPFFAETKSSSLLPTKIFLKSSFVAFSDIVFLAIQVEHPQTLCQTYQSQCTADVIHSRCKLLHFFHQMFEQDSSECHTSSSETTFVPESSSSFSEELLPPGREDEGSSRAHQFQTFVQLHGDGNILAAAIHLFKEQYASVHGALSDTAAADHVGLSKRGHRRLVKEFFDFFGGVVSDYRAKKVKDKTTGEEKWVREYAGAVITDINTLVIFYVELARELGLLTLEKDETIRIMLYHDAAASLPRERKLNGFFLHFLQIAEPGSVFALLPFAVLHGTDSSAHMRSFFADHEAFCPQIMGAGGQKVLVRMAIAEQLSKLKPGIDLEDGYHPIVLGLYADYAGMESVVYSNDVVIQAAVRYPGVPTEVARVNKKGILNCCWTTWCPCWQCGRKAWQMYEVIERGRKFGPPPGRKTVFGPAVDFFMYGRLHGIPLVVGAFLYDLHAALLKHRLGKESVATREIKSAFVATTPGGFKGSWAPAKNLDKHGNPLPRVPAAGKQTRAKGEGISSRPDYKTVIAWIATGRYKRVLFAVEQFVDPPVRNLHVTLQNLITFVETIYNSGANAIVDVEGLRSLGEKIWNAWVVLLSRVFPADVSALPEAIRGSRQAPRFDPHNLACHAGAHNTLIHQSEYVEACGAYYHAAFEAAGEAALFRLTCIYNQFSIFRARVHAQPAWNLVRGIANVFGRLLAARRTGDGDDGQVRRYRRSKRPLAVVVDIDFDDFRDHRGRRSDAVLVSDTGESDEGSMGSDNHSEISRASSEGMVGEEPSDA